MNTSMLKDDACAAVLSSPEFQSERGTAPTGMSDDEREAAIQRAGCAIERHMAIWEREGCMGARGDADRARRLMEQLIAGRSAEQVKRMQDEQAQRIAQEPGAERA